MKITTYKCDVCKMVYNDTNKIVGVRFGSGNTKNEIFAECAEYECLGHICIKCSESSARLFNARKPKPVDEKQPDDMGTK